MKSYPQNGWFHSAEFLRAAQAVHAARGSLNYMHTRLLNCKYVQLYVDQRTGSFIFRDGEGNMLTHAEVYLLFPSLEGDSPFAANAPDDVDTFVAGMTKQWREDQ